MRSSHDIDGLLVKLGISASDAPRILEALTHGSVNQTGGKLVKNERLAFLGDAVIELAIRDSMFRTDTGGTPGTLSVEKAKAVRNKRLAERARTISLGDYVDLGKGAESVRDGDKVLASALEAVMGAVFLEKGFQAAAQCAMGVLKP